MSTAGCGCKWKARWERERAARLEAERIAEKATADALRDPLTGLANRRLLLDRVEIALAQAAREGESVALLFVDLDRFKRINDTYGHELGDEMLREVTRRLLATARSSDTVARFGGDEFAILLRPIEDDRTAQAVSEKILSALTSDMVLGAGRVFSMTASVGYVVAAPGDGSSARQMLRDADTAMYQSKGAGRARVLPFDRRLRQREAQRLTVESELTVAVRAEQLVLHYQPIQPLASDIASGVEALVRWRHPTRGLLGPGEFIDVAEVSGLIVPLGEWVIREACATQAAWERDRARSERTRSATEPGLGSYVAINVSPLQLARPSFAETLRGAIVATGVDPASVCVEVTESSLVSDGLVVANNLREVARLGCRLAIDDFGTGYSSLGYLRRFEVDTIKIDRSFVSDLETSREAVAVVKAMVAMAKALGVTTVAEGIETAGQARVLTELGCDLGQGFLFARPAPAPELSGAWSDEPLEGRAAVIGGAA